MVKASFTCRRLVIQSSRINVVPSDVRGQGTSIKYVRTEGEGGSKKPENMRTIRLIGCVKSVQEGGRGSKKPENMRTIGLIGCVKSVQEEERG